MVLIFSKIPPSPSKAKGGLRGRENKVHDRRGKRERKVIINSEIWKIEEGLSWGALATRLRRTYFVGSIIYYCRRQGRLMGIFEVYLFLSKIYYNCELDHFALLKGRPTSPLADVVYDKWDLIFFSLWGSLEEIYNFLFNFLKSPFKYYCLRQEKEWKKKKDIKCLLFIIISKKGKNYIKSRQNSSINPLNSNIWSRGNSLLAILIGLCISQSILHI